MHGGGHSLKSNPFLLVTEIDVEQVKNLDLKEIRSITEKDFTNSLKRIRCSVAPQSIIAYERWAKDYGDVTY